MYGNEIINDPTRKVSGTELARSTWLLLNRIRTHQRKCGACLFKWGIIQTPSCDCGALEQTVAYIAMFCHLRYFHGSFTELCEAKTNRALDWLRNLDIIL